MAVGPKQGTLILGQVKGGLKSIFGGILAEKENCERHLRDCSCHSGIRLVFCGHSVTRLKLSLFTAPNCLCARARLGQQDSGCE